MNFATAMPNITHTDAWLIVLLACFSIVAIKACRGFKMPDPSMVQSYATVTNTPGGIILILLFLWLFTLSLTVAFCVWVIVKGVDPQHAVVITLIGTLTGTAFGNVNGAFFKTMTGQDPHPIPPVNPAPPEPK